MTTSKIKTETINRNIIFDKFLCIEGWAYRAKVLTEKGMAEKTKEALRRIHNELMELDILLKYNPDIEL